MINSNFYGIDTVLVDCKATQAAKAANCIYHLLQFRRLIERQELEPVSNYLFIKINQWDCPLLDANKHIYVYQI